MKQLDIYGNEISMEELYPQKEPYRKYPNMQEKYGIVDNETCGDCKFFLEPDYHCRTYFKCELKGVSHSTTTDIRKSAKACGKFIGEE